MSEVILKKWFISSNRLYGEAYGHPKFKDGAYVVTTEIKDMNIKNGYRMAQTRNTLYRLNDEDEKED